MSVPAGLLPALGRLLLLSAWNTPLEVLAALYRIEDNILGHSADERRAIRQRRSRLLVDARPWLREKLSLISQKTKLAEAIRYALSRWGGAFSLPRRLAHRDRQQRHRACHPPAGPQPRKNALFAGSASGAEHWAIIASLIEICKLLAVEPCGYLADVITSVVNGHPQTRA